MLINVLFLLLVVIPLAAYLLAKHSGKPFEKKWLPLFMIAAAGVGFLGVFVWSVQRTPLNLWVIAIALVPMVAAFGFRGETFHWKRVPFALIGWHGLVLLSGKISVSEEYSLAVGLTLLWGLPAVTIAGYWGEPFHTERFGRGTLGQELLALNHDSMTRFKSLGFVLLALSLAFPRVPIALIHSSEMIVTGLFYLVVVGGIAWWVLYTSKAKAIKENIDYLGNEAAINASKSVANAGPSGVLVGEIGGHALRVPIEDRAVVIGPPGTGKTAFLVSQLLDWTQSGRSFVCMDIKPEIYGIVKKELTAKGYTLYTYNPTQRTGQRYNLFDDVNGPEHIGELASALIPSPDPKNMVFTESARDILDAILSHLKQTEGAVTLPGVMAYISQFEDHKALLKDLRQSDDVDAKNLAIGLKQTAVNERLLGSIFAVFRSNLRFLRYPAIRESLQASDFSLAELKKEKVGIFLQFEESTKELTGKLASVLIGHLFRYLILNWQRDAVLLLLDEIGNMPLIEGFKEKLNTIRSRNIPTWMYWQSKEQMQAYGEKADEGPNIILGACDLQMVFRLNDNASAEWFSEKIGTVDRLVKKTATSGRLFGEVSHSQDLVTEPLIRPHELQQLGQNEVVCMYRGKAWRGQAVPYYDRWPAYRGKKPTAADCIGTAYRQEEVLNGVA